MTPTETSPDRHTASPADIVEQLILSAWMSQGVAAAAELGVADALAAGPLPIGELAVRVGADADALGRLLRALIGSGVFARSEDGRYELNPAAELLRSDAPVSMAAMARFVGSRQHREHWSLLTDAVRSGRSLVPAQRGKSFFEFLGDEPEFGRIFNDAMTSLSGVAIGPVVDAYDFARFRTIVDVAGGHGRLLAAILKSAPDAEGVLYDLPEVIAGASPLLREDDEDDDVAERVRLAGGSFFDGVPAGGDAYVLKHIIHDWGDDESVQILRNVRSAAAPGATLLLIETVIPEGEGASIGKWVDIEMLVVNNGRERTESEYRRLLERAGFEMIGVLGTTSRLSIVEARAV
jgi:hypothetical protein